METEVTAPCLKSHTSWSYLPTTFTIHSEVIPTFRRCVAVDLCFIFSFHNSVCSSLCYEYCMSCPSTSPRVSVLDTISSRSRWLCAVQPIDGWDRGFVSRWRPRCPSVVSVAVSATSLSLVQRSPTGCVCVCVLCDLETPTKRRFKTKFGCCATE